MHRTVAVIGCNSFSGSHFTAILLEAGYRVVGISRSARPHAAFLPSLPDAAAFVFHRMDINADLEEIVRIMKRERPSWVVNFAAQGMVAESWKRPGDWFRTNTLSQVLLHERLRTFDFLEKYVHISTPEVYGSFATPKSEGTDYQPTTPYAVSRAATDMSLMSFFHAYGFPVVFTRAANVYGPGQQLYRLIPRAIVAALTGATMRLNNGGASRRSFIHIRDAMAATLAVMERGTPGGIYHIATQRLSTVREAAALAAHAAGRELDEVAEPGPPRPNRDAAYCLDSSKIRAELGWSDATKLEDGIAETVDWARKNLAILRGLPLEYEHKA